MVITSRNWFAMQGPVAIILNSWNVIFIWETCYWTRTKISQQPENCENRNDPDLLKAFLKKSWVESDFKAPNLPLFITAQSFRLSL
jgi:hypothetical protein